MIFSCFSCPEASSTVPCLVGNYVSGDKLSCEPCPAGSYCPENLLDSPIVCTNGTYQNETGQASCNPCPAGQSCLSVFSSPVDCPDRTYSDVGVSQCIPCPSGYR